MLQGCTKYYPENDGCGGRKNQLQVVDNGIGITKDDIGKVFEKFYRGALRAMHNVKGFGQLVYTKNICEAHGWKINMESEPGRGTTVTIII
ncbi:MAG: sensor histidine kinase [Saprospiraceae bacterium]|nr:sensor histidine kinase [Saprospiraceae bacterium]